MVVFFFLPVLTASRNLQKTIVKGKIAEISYKLKERKIPVKNSKNSGHLA